MCAFAVPADANVMVTCRRLSNDEPEVIEINRDDSDNSAVIITTPTTKGLILKPCGRKRRQFVAEYGDSRRKRQLSPNSTITVAKFGDSRRLFVSSPAHSDFGFSALQLFVIYACYLCMYIVTTQFIQLVIHW